MMNKLVIPDAIFTPVAQLRENALGHSTSPYLASG